MLLIVDMLRGFMEEGYPLYCGNSARLIIPHIVSLAQETKKNSGKIIQIADRHTPDDLEFQLFPPHCIAGTREAEIIPELKDFGYYIPKQHFDPFIGSAVLLGDIIWGNNPSVTVTGVCTDICVLYTVAGLCMRGYSVTVYSNCVASFNQDNHDYALKHMETVLGVQIKTYTP